MNQNKKGYVNDIVTMTGVLFGLFVVLGLAIFLIIEYNDAFQNSSIVQKRADVAELQQSFTDTYPEMMGWIWTSSLVGMVIYTLITAYLVNVISKVWFIIGVSTLMIQAIASFAIQKAYEQMSTASVFGTSVTYIPGASLYFSNVIEWNAFFGFLILLVLYFKEDA